MPRPSRSRIADAFFVLNILGVALTAYLLLQYAVRDRDAALASSERLLLNVLPRPDRQPAPRERSHRRAARRRPVLFADVVDFTPYAEATSPTGSSSCSTRSSADFDPWPTGYGIEKIKTIGDAYMAVAGRARPRAGPRRRAMPMALAMLDALVALRRHRDARPVAAGRHCTRARWWPASSAAASSSTTCGATP